eukprot:5287674-Alexandrium_andersonii.AAC.1
MGASTTTVLGCQRATATTARCLRSEVLRCSGEDPPIEQLGAAIIAVPGCSGEVPPAGLMGSINHDSAGMPS